MGFQRHCRYYQIFVYVSISDKGLKEREVGGLQDRGLYTEVLTLIEGVVSELK